MSAPDNADAAAAIARRVSDTATLALDRAIPRALHTRTDETAHQWRDALAALQVAAERWTRLAETLAARTRRPQTRLADLVTDAAVADARAAALRLAGADERARHRALHGPVELPIECPTCRNGARVQVLTKLVYAAPGERRPAADYAPRPTRRASIPPAIVAALREQGRRWTGHGSPDDPAQWVIDPAIVAAARRAGMTYAQIGRTIGVSRQRVFQIDSPRVRGEKRQGEGERAGKELVGDRERPES